MAELIPAAVEIKVVALLARGDKYEYIREYIKTHLNYSISVPSITNIKKRNTDNIAMIREKMAVQEQATAEQLLDRTRNLLNRRLSSTERDVEKYEMYVKQLDSGEINHEEFYALTRYLKLPAMVELTNVSKEMFHQSRTEAGQPTSVISNPDTAREKLKELQGILEENDEITLERIVFAKREQSETLPPTIIQNGTDGSS